MSEKLYQTFHKTIKKHITDNNFDAIQGIFTDIFDGLSMTFEGLECSYFKFQKIEATKSYEKLLYWSSSKKNGQMEPGYLIIIVKTDDGVRRKCQYNVFIDGKKRAIFEKKGEKRLSLKDFVSIFMKYPQQISVEEEHDRIQKALFMHM